MQDVKPTKDKNEAIKRLIVHLPPTVEVKKAKKGWDIIVNNYTVTKNPKKALALLVTMLLLDANFEGIRDRVAWNGSVPTGLNAHEDFALRQLQRG